MKAIGINLSAAALALLLSTQTVYAANWIAINNELSMDSDSVRQQGALRKVTIKLKGGVHEVLVFCQKRALLFNQEMIPASETPAGTSLVGKVCDEKKKWYEKWR